MDSWFDTWQTQSTVVSMAIGRSTRELASSGIGWTAQLWWKDLLSKIILVYRWKAEQKYFNSKKFSLLHPLPTRIKRTETQLIPYKYLTHSWIIIYKIFRRTLILKSLLFPGISFTFQVIHLHYRQINDYYKPIWLWSTLQIEDIL